MSRLREGGDRCDTAASTELTSGRDEQVDWGEPIDDRRVNISRRWNDMK